MTLQELYEKIGGDYEQALRVLRVEKLVDKHIRKFTENGVVEALLASRQEKDPGVWFERAHAVKGICANLGLNDLSAAAAAISDDFRPGSDRKLSDEEIDSLLNRVEELYQKTAEGIAQYKKS